MKTFILTMFILYGFDAASTLIRIGWYAYPIKIEKRRADDATRLVISAGFSLWILLLLIGGAS